MHLYKPKAKEQHVNKAFSGEKTGVELSHMILIEMLKLGTVDP